MGESASARIDRGVPQQAERGGSSLSGVRAAVPLGVAGGVERTDAGCFATWREAAGAGASDRVVPAGLLALPATAALIEVRCSGCADSFTRVRTGTARQWAHERNPDRQLAYATGRPPRWRDAPLFAGQRVAVLGRCRAGGVAIARSAHLRPGILRGLEGARESATHGR